MATVLTPPPAPSKHDARLRDELRQVASRIRTNEVLVGLFALAVVGLGYAVAGVLLDRLFELPAVARQVGLGVFGLLLVAVGYRWIVRPLRRTVNPRFAARQVEATVPDAKNAVINWVDLQGAALPDSVRRAVGVQAAEGVRGADTAKAADKPTLVWLAATAGLLVAVLAVLFVVLKPAPFLSLLGRTFNPFTSGAIATRTTITFIEPATGDATVTSGDTFVVAVYIDGSVPDPHSPDRVRLQVRYNPESPEYDEVPLDPGTSNREWQLRVSQGVIQNGFWYRIAAGDGRTTEYRLTVRSRPLVRVDHVRYEYPAYTRMPPEEARDPLIRAYRGTQVTVTAHTDQPAKSGWLQAPGQKSPLTAEVIGEKRDTLRFHLTLTDGGSYRVGFTTDYSEVGESPQAPIDVLVDQPPTLTINAPVDEEITKPANGLLEVDGVIGDDFGIDAVSLVLRANGAKQPLLIQKYREGQSLKRESDGTLPTALDYKDSVPLASLNPTAKDSLGLAPGTVLEYWLEATDNCTVPRPNIGRSAVKRIKLTEPEKEKPKKDEIARQQKQRLAAEGQHRKQQDEQFRQENRDPKALHRDNTEPQEGNPASEPQDGSPKSSPDQAPDPGMREAGNPPRNEPNPAEAPMPRPANDPGVADGQPNPMPSDSAASQPPTAADQPPAPKENEQKPIDQKAEQVKNAIDQQMQQPGQARQHDSAQQQPEASPANQKPSGQQPEAGTPSEQKAEPQPADGGRSSAESKGAGSPPPPNPPGSQPDAANPAGQERPAPNADSSQEAGSEPRAGDGKGSRPVDPATAKPSTNTEPNPTQGGGQAKPEPMDSSSADHTPSTSRPESTKPSGAANSSSSPERGSEKPSNPAGNTGGSSKADPQQVEQAMRDLAGNDESKKQAAREQLDRSIGKDARQRAEQIANDMKSPDPKKREAAQKQAGELSREIDRGGDIPPPPDEKVERLMRDRAQDLASNDPNKRKAAEKEIDQAVGPEARDELQKAAKNLNSTNPREKQAAQDKVDELAKKGAQQSADRKAQPPQPGTSNAKTPNTGDPAAGEKPSAEKAQELARKANDLNSPDPAKRQAAEKEFDNLAGEQARKELQADLASGDAAKQKAAQDRVADLAKKPDNKPDPKTMTPEQREQAAKQMEQLQKDAENLASQDPKARAAAEKKFDDLIGQQNREQLQKDVEDLKSGDPQRQKAAQDRLKDAQQKLQQMAKDGQKGQPETPSDQPPKDWQPGGLGGKGPGEILHKDDPKNRLKSAELQLAEFEKNKHNKALHDKLGMNEEEYGRFLEGYQRRVAEMREDAQKATPRPTPRSTGPATVRVGEGSGGTKLETLPNGAVVPPGSSGPGTAPPGFSDAQRRFAEEAAKLRRKQ